MTTAGILLAAGASRRFGPDDKLLAPRNGRPLVSHAADALRAFGPDVLIGVARSKEVMDQLDGFACVAPDGDGLDQADSLRAGVALARDQGADRALIMLGDMPFVTADLLRQVAERCTDSQPSAATDGQRPMPPACFPKALFPNLMSLSGDRGASALLKPLPDAALVPAPLELLRDVDVPSALHQG